MESPASLALSSPFSSSSSSRPPPASSLPLSLSLFLPPSRRRALRIRRSLPRGFFIPPMSLFLSAVRAHNREPAIEAPSAHLQQPITALPSYMLYSYAERKREEEERQREKGCCCCYCCLWNVGIYGNGMRFEGIEGLLACYTGTRFVQDVTFLSWVYDFFKNV